MRSIRLRNFRSLLDTGEIELRPLTILLGENSSGKSTFLRALPLLKQSVQAQTTGPFLWYGPYVDFGTFRNTLNAAAETPHIAVDYAFTVRAEATRSSELFQYYYGLHLLEDIEVTVSLALAGMAEGGSRVAAIRMSLADHVVDIQMGEDGDVTVFRVNDTDICQTSPGVAVAPSQLFPVVRQLYKSDSDPRAARDSARFYWGRYSEPPPGLLSALNGLFHGRTSDTTRRGVAARLGVGSSESMLQQLKQTPGPSSFRQRAAGLKGNSVLFRRVRDQVVAHSVTALLEYANSYLAVFGSNISYIAPVRSSAERYYRPQGLAVTEVDATGKNLAVFLRSLDHVAQASFEAWTQRAIGRSVVARAEAGHMSLYVLEADGREYNLADYGFGLSQVAPILAQLWLMTTRGSDSIAPYGIRAPRVLAVEQPELHLHPRMQSQVADVFIQSLHEARHGGIDLRLVVETHSEALVNRLGHQIASGAIDSALVHVLIFERHKPSETRVRVAHYTEDGYLTNWPYGFFSADRDADRI